MEINKLCDKRENYGNDYFVSMSLYLFVNLYLYGLFDKSWFLCFIKERYSLLVLCWLSWGKIKIWYNVW